jgi:hypothetical protein
MYVSWNICNSTYSAGDEESVLRVAENAAVLHPSCGFASIFNKVILLPSNQFHCLMSNAASSINEKKGSKAGFFLFFNPF